MSFDELFSAGRFPTSTVGEPGAQGETVFGMQGAGVKNTGGGFIVAGLVGLLHMPNGIILLIGLKSIIVASGIDEVSVFDGVATRLDGAAPNEHCSTAPVQTEVLKTKTS